MRNARRERELRALLRMHQKGEENLADYLAAHGAELGLDIAVRTGPDEMLAPRLFTELARRREEDERASQASLLATLNVLRQGIRWRDAAAVLTATAFFRLAATAAKCRYVRFVGDKYDISISRQLLHRAGMSVRRFRDVSVFLDVEGIHIRWDGRGGFNFHPQPVKSSEATLVVVLPPRPVQKTMPALLGEVLAEMGFGI